MAIRYRLGKYFPPSGVGLAAIEVPALNSEQNMALVDKSYTWEENITNVNAAVIETTVSGNGYVPGVATDDFLVTNVVTTSTNDKKAVPLYYKHTCRFFHYTYGENPTEGIYILDQDENILKDINYRIKITRQTKYVYKIEILTDFKNNEYVIYKVKYNKCMEDGTSISPSWVETLNVEELFVSGQPNITPYQYTSFGPDTDGSHTVIVPPIPLLSELTNSTGVSFETAPVIVEQNISNNNVYYGKVTYTLKATGTSTFTIKRDQDRYNDVKNDYLTSATTDSWGSATNFNLGTTITGLPGITLTVYADAYLKIDDEISFSASPSYYYVKPKSYTSIFLRKPDNVTSADDWYISVKNGMFRRQMTGSGVAFASGVGQGPLGNGSIYEYRVPEYAKQVFDFEFDRPYIQVSNERAEILDSHTIQLKKTPLFIDASSTLYNDVPTESGFPRDDYITVDINDTTISQENILDWDVYNGLVKLADAIDSRDDVVVTYHFKQDFYEYPGFYGSGNPYPEESPFPWFGLDLNPTPFHNYDMYMRGNIAHVFIKPYKDISRNVGLNTADCLYHNFTGTPSGSLDFELGSVSLGLHCKISDIDLIDVRTRGGGMSKLGIEEINDVKNIQPEAEMYWDVGYFDGKAIPSHGVLVVEVPKTVLSTNGGNFTEDEVRAKIIKHMALGTFPIINYV